jgi:hypothetical protein
MSRAMFAPAFTTMLPRWSCASVNVEVTATYRDRIAERGLRSGVPSTDWSTAARAFGSLTFLIDGADVEIPLAEGMQVKPGDMLPISMAMLMKRIPP